MHPPAGDDAALARRLAQDTGAMLMRRRRTGGTTNQLRRTGDREAHRLLIGRLSQLRPKDAVLSEEGADDEGRLAAARVWLVDPLDGTREYGEGRRDWAVHVALWERGELVAGAVALPAFGTTLATDAPPTVPRRRSGPWRVAVSRSRPDPSVLTAVEELAAEVVPMGSAGFKAAAVIRGDVDAYVHAGGQYEWDSAAPVAVARAAGLHASRLDGAPLTYNAPDPYLPDLVICCPELVDELLAVVANVGAVGTRR